MTQQPTPPAAATAPTVALLDCAAVAEWLAARGMRGLRGPLTAKAVLNWATEGKLPMWPSPAGRMVITEAALNNWISREQTKAQRVCDDAQASSKRAPARRSRRR